MDPEHTGEALLSGEEEKKRTAEPFGRQGFKIDEDNPTKKNCVPRNEGEAHVRVRGKASGAGGFR